MIAELGHAALWLAAAFAGLQAIAGFGRAPADLAAPAAYAQATLAIVALASLVGVFVAVDLSVELVVANADLRLPTPYLVAAALTSSPSVLASMLLATVGAVAGLRGAGAALLGRLGLASLILDASLLVANPFARADPAPTAGNGFDASMQFPPLVVAVPLAAAAVVALVAGVAGWSRDSLRRGAWAAAGLFAAAAVVRLWAAWSIGGSLAGPDARGVLYAFIVAAVVASIAGGRRRDWLAVLVAAGVAFAGTLGGSAATVALGNGQARVGDVTLRLVGLAPVAGANWSAVEAGIAVTSGGTVTTLRPQWRDYATPRTTMPVAATLGGIALALRAVPAAGVSLRVERRPYIWLLWLGGAGLVAGAIVVAIRR